MFRPAKNVKPLAPTKTAYRVKESSCDSIGFVIQAESIDDLAETAANHGANQYKILDDFGHDTVETDFVAGKTFGVVQGRASSRVQKNHMYTAEAYNI